MKSKKLAGVGVAVGAATTVTALLLGGTVATAAESSTATRPETAFAFATKGLLPLGPLAKVASPDGTPQHAELAGLASVPGASAAGFSGGLLTSDAKAGLATTSVANLKLSTLLSGDLIKTTCENGKGSVSIVNGKLLGTALPASPVSGQAIDLSPLATASLGEETRNADGSITVTGIKISVLPGTGGTLPGLPDLGSILGGLTGGAGTGTTGTGSTGTTGGTGSGATTGGGIVPIAYSQPLVADPGGSDDPGSDDAGSATTQDTGTTQDPGTTQGTSTPPAAGLPSLPNLNLPGVGSLPGLGSLPSVPNLGSVPSLGGTSGTSGTTAAPAATTAALTITIGSATCGTVGGDDGHHPGDGDDHDGHDKDHDKDGGHHKADDADDDDDSDVGDAPAPDVVEASLPVTG